MSELVLDGGIGGGGVWRCVEAYDGGGVLVKWQCQDSVSVSRLVIVRRRNDLWYFYVVAR
jgi:hypothetical protein